MLHLFVGWLRTYSLRLTRFRPFFVLVTEYALRGNSGETTGGTSGKWPQRATKQVQHEVATVESALDSTSSPCSRQRGQQNADVALLAAQLPPRVKGVSVNGPIWWPQGMPHVEPSPHRRAAQRVNRASRALHRRPTREPTTRGRYQYSD